MSFESDMEKFATKTRGRMDLIVRRLVLEISRSLVMMSPVGNPTLWKSPPPKGYVGGRFRANWQHGVGAINDKTTNDIDKSGSMTIARLGSAAVGAGTVQYITNSLPYAQVLEDGHSTQAPHGMVKVTVARINRFLVKAAKTNP